MGQIDPEFEAFVRARSDALLRTAALLVGDRGRAEDVVQETLVRLAQNWRKAQRDGRPEAYARSILYSRAIDSHRWFARRPERGGSVPDVPAPGPDADARIVLADALARLTTRQRALLVLRYYDDLTEVRTADVLGISPSTVKSETRVALARLRTLAPELAETFDRTPRAPRTLSQPREHAPQEVAR